MKNSALIFGISGQDGAYLSKLLLEKGYIVSGTSRNIKLNGLSNLDYLGIKNNIRSYSVSPTNYKDVFDVIKKTKPDEIYNLSGQSSVGLSFEKPKETFESIVLGNFYILEAIRDINPKIKFYNACSGECFGNTDDNAASESSPFKPCSPYAIAKLSTFWQTKLYRDAYQLFACSGILFNHESPLRSMRFVTQKIISTAVKIASGSDEKLVLGNISIKRDWGWAPEYVDAMQRMMQIDKADDFIIATGTSHSLEDFIAITFEKLNMDWKDHVIVDKKLYRPSEIQSNRGDASKASRILGWNATNTISNIIQSMLNDARKV
jgi:GDPmannose 4,6-dehydratase